MTAVLTFLVEIISRGDGRHHSSTLKRYHFCQHIYMKMFQKEKWLYNSYKCWQVARFSKKNIFKALNGKKCG